MNEKNVFLVARQQNLWRHRIYTNRISALCYITYASLRQIDFLTKNRWLLGNSECDVMVTCTNQLSTSKYIIYVSFIWSKDVTQELYFHSSLLGNSEGDVMVPAPMDSAHRNIYYICECHFNRSYWVSSKMSAGVPVVSLISYIDSFTLLKLSVQGKYILALN